MIVNLVDTDYSTIVENFLSDIEDNYKYLDSYRMTFESSILLKDSFNMEELNEAVGEYWDKFKAKIKSFIEAIKELWNKFWSKIENKVMGDVEWLNKYSKALLSAEIPDLDFTMYGYFEQEAINFRNKLMGNNLIPSYNPNDSKLFEALETSDKFRETYLKSFLVKDKTLNEGIKYMVRGKMEDPKAYDKNTISAQMRHMVEYCIDYPKLARTLQKEKSDLERDLNRISRDIDKIKVTDNKEKTNESLNFTNAINMGQSLLIEGCNFDQLPLLERYELFNEEGGVKISGDTDKTKTGAVHRDEEGKIGKIEKEVKDNDTKDSIAKRYTVYMTEVYNIIGIRMTVAEEIYTTYIQLLKYIGEDFTRKDRDTPVKTSKGNKEGDDTGKEPREGDTGKDNGKIKGKGGTGKGIINSAKQRLSNFASLFK